MGKTIITKKKTEYNAKKIKYYAENTDFGRFSLDKASARKMTVAPELIR